MSPKAKESDSVTRAREKLKKQFEDEAKLITSDALNEVQDRIYRWIERHSRERINLREKNIEQYTLFDTNEHSAKTASKFIDRLRGQIKREITRAPEDISSLRGRIKKVKNE